MSGAEQDLDEDIPSVTARLAFCTGAAIAAVAAKAAKARVLDFMMRGVWVIV